MPETELRILTEIEFQIKKIKKSFFSIIHLKLVSLLLHFTIVLCFHFHHYAFQFKLLFEIWFCLHSLPIKLCYPIPPQLVKSFHCNKSYYAIHNLILSTPNPPFFTYIFGTALLIDLWQCFPGFPCTDMDMSLLFRRWLLTCSPTLIFLVNDPSGNTACTWGTTVELSMPDSGPMVFVSWRMRVTTAK